MKKIIFSICFVLITLMGIACVSACDANNCTVDNQQISECDIDNCAIDDNTVEDESSANSNEDYSADNTFIPDDTGDYIFPVTFDPVNDILKVNPDCPYINPDVELKYEILMTNRYYAPDESYTYAMRS